MAPNLAVAMARVWRSFFGYYSYEGCCISVLEKQMMFPCEESFNFELLQAFKYPSKEQFVDKFVKDFNHNFI